MAVPNNIRPRITYAVVVIGLLMLISAGHHTAWRFGLATSSRDLDHVETHASSVQSARIASPDKLQVSQAEIEKSGIKIEPVGQCAMAHVVAASGTVQYNQNFVAQLSSRVAGNVWRVEKQVGHSVRKGDVLALIESIEVGRAKAEFLQAVVDSDTKAKTLERLNQVNLSIPERQIRDAKAQLREARIRLFNSQQTLVNLGLPISLDQVKGAPDDVLARQIQFLGLPNSCATRSIRHRPRATWFRSSRRSMAS